MRTSYSYRRHIKRANRFNRRFKRSLQRFKSPLGRKARWRHRKK